MVGENIQKFRDQFQATRSQMMTGNLRIGEKISGMRILGGNPGMLGNIQIGKKFRERLQAVKGVAISPPPSRTKTGGGKTFIDRPSVPGKQVISV